MSSAAPELLATTARARLSAFKVPTLWIVVADSQSVPLSATGKLDKPALQRLLRERGARLRVEHLLLQHVKKRREPALHLLDDRERLAMHGRGTELRERTPVLWRRVALVPGETIAGMLAVETRASAAVGVAISVTTIPATAFLGVALGTGELGKSWSALAVLAVNIAMMLAGGSLTLAVQRLRAPRASAPA